MADKKISQLTPAATPLAGTETLPIVQGGATVQVSINNLTTGKPVAASQLTIENNSADTAVRITQTGAGNALVVEDEANPDASPFVIGPAGNVGIGTTAPPFRLTLFGADGIPVLFSGASKGVRFGFSSIGSNIEGVDSSGTASFQPINIGGSIVTLATGGTEKARVKATGQVRFVPLASAPSGAETGDVYYNSVDNKLYCYNGTSWNALF